MLISLCWFAVNRDPDLSALRLEHDVLPTHAPDHVERLLRFAAQGQRFHVLRNAAFADGTHILLERKEAFRRAQSFDALMRTLVVVVLHPVGNAFHRALEGFKTGPLQELRPDGFPEPLDLAERHGMVGCTADVMHMVTGQRVLKARFPVPRHILPAIVGQHLLGLTVFTRRPTVHLQHIFRGLAPEESQAHDVPGVVVNEPDQVGVLMIELEAEDIALPHLVRRGTLKEPRFLRILLGLFDRFRNRQFVTVQRLAHRLRTGLHE
jgi:hypothetical protein